MSVHVPGHTPQRATAAPPRQSRGPLPATTAPPGALAGRHYDVSAPLFALRPAFSCPSRGGLRPVCVCLLVARHCRLLWLSGVVRGLMLRGLMPTTSRAGLLTAAQTSTCDHTKVVVKRHGLLDEGLTLHVLGAGVSGFCAAVACTPADVLKSRLMASRTAGGGGRGGLVARGSGSGSGSGHVRLPPWLPAGLHAARAHDLCSDAHC